jgi:hypothetical protein
MHDYLGNPVAGDNTATLAAIDDFVGGFLAYETRAEGILAAADADPDSVLGNVYAGFLLMFSESPQGPLLATPYLLRAERLLARLQVPRREQLSTTLLRAWVENDLARVLQLSEQLLDEFPRDLFAAKLNQYVEFNRGNSPAMLRIAHKALRHAEDIAHAHGMLAFALEQCHLLKEAEQAARSAFLLQHKEPWAQHALAHVLLTQGRIEEGTAFLESVSDTWVGLNSFMYTHNWWHLALFYLARGRERDALDIYDRHVWGIAPDYSQDQIGAVSLLTRLELAGVDVGSRWDDLAVYLRRRVGDTVQPFLSLQYLYGLARAGAPEAQTLLDSIRRQAEQALPYDQRIWREIAVPAAEGLLAQARGESARAVRLLGASLPRLTEIGGSHAQRDLFAQIALEASRRGGDRLTVQQALEVRRGGDPFDVPTNRALARLYAELDLPQEAAQAQKRIDQVLGYA